MTNMQYACPYSHPGGPIIPMYCPGLYSFIFLIMSGAQPRGWPANSATYWAQLSWSAEKRKAFFFHFTNTEFVKNYILQIYSTSNLFLCCSLLWVDITIIRRHTHFKYLFHLGVESKLKKLISGFWKLKSHQHFMFNVYKMSGL